MELKGEREEYIVTAGLVPELAGEFVTKTLFPRSTGRARCSSGRCAFRAPDGKDLEWWRSAREAAEMAMKSWVRVRANMNLGAYDIFRAEGAISEPEWPDARVSGS